jgi:hypothetical protein
LFGELKAAFFQCEMFGRHFFAEGVHIEFVVEFLPVEFGALGAEAGAFGEIGEALEGEELGGGEVFGTDGLAGGVDDGFVEFLRGARSLDVGEVFEFGISEFWAGANAVVQSAEERHPVVQGLEGFAGDVQAETFGTGFADAFEDVVEGVPGEPGEEIGDLGLGEGGKGALFSHKSSGEKGEIRDLRRSEGAKERKGKTTEARRHRGGE